MALSITLTRFGYTAGYLKLNRIDHFDKLTRECQAVFSLYKDQQTAALPPRDARGAPLGEPLVARAAVLTLKGAAFDRYFAKGVAGREQIEQQLYRAAKAEAVDSWAGRLVLAAADDV